jgi:hypothetical protein
VQSDDRRRLARLRLRARHRREGELRRRALFLSLSLFALLWVAVFAQMISGHDPVLASGTRVAAVTNNEARPARRAQAKATREQGAELALDPQTGSIQEVPRDSEGGSTAMQTAPVTPAPVVTSQS